MNTNSGFLEHQGCEILRRDAGFAFRLELGQLQAVAEDHHGARLDGGVQPKEFLFVINGGAELEFPVTDPGAADTLRAARILNDAHELQVPVRGLIPRQVNTAPRFERERFGEFDVHGRLEGQAAPERENADDHPEVSHGSTLTVRRLWWMK